MRFRRLRRGHGGVILPEWSVTWLLVFVRLYCFYIVASICQSQSIAGLEYSVNEESRADTFVANLLIDSGLSVPSDVDLEFSLSPNSDANAYLFTLDLYSGQLYTSQVIDREKFCALQDECVVNLIIIVQPVEYFTILQATVHIIDRNDNPPNFSQTVYQKEISEAAMVGTALSLSQAEDLDSSGNGIEEYVLESGGPFALQYTQRPDGSYDLSIVVESTLDRETEDHYEMRIIARDFGEPPLTGTTLVIVTVLDANDNSPVFLNSSYEVSIPENSQAGTSLVTVSAEDADEDLNALVIYGLSSSAQENYGDLFDVNYVSGLVTLKQPLDYEQSPQYILDLMASDRGAIPQVTYVRLTVNVLDLNDRAPVINVDTLTDTGVGHVKEHEHPGYFAAYLTVMDPDGGEESNVNCSLISDYFNLVQDSETEYRIVSAVEFDREFRENYEVTVVCHDSGVPPMYSTVNVDILILDINDQFPEFAQHFYSVTIEENLPAGMFLIQLSAIDGDTGQNAVLRYGLQNISQADIVTVNSNNGTVLTAAPLDYETAEHHTIFLVVTDGGFYDKSDTALLEINVIDVNDIPPVFNQTSYTFYLEENLPGNLALGEVHASDPEMPPFNNVTYYLQDASGLFDIDSTTGLLSVLNTTDREQTPEYNFNVVAANAGYGMSSSASVTVVIEDVNDNMPYFLFPNANNRTLTIPADTPAEYVLMRLVAVDLDADATLLYGITHGGGDAIGVRENGEIYTKTDLASVSRQQYNIGVSVSDYGSPPLQFLSSLEVRLDAGLSFATWPGVFVPGQVVPVEPTPQAAATDPFWNNWNNITFLIAGFVFLIIIITIICLVYCRRRKQIKSDDQGKDEVDRQNAANALANGHCKSCNGAPPSGDGMEMQTVTENPGNAFTIGDIRGESSTDEVIVTWPPPGLDIAAQLIEKSRARGRTRNGGEASGPEGSEPESFHPVHEVQDSGVDVSWADHLASGSDAGSKQGSLVELRAPQSSNNSTPRTSFRGLAMSPYGCMEQDMDEQLMRYLARERNGSETGSVRSVTDSGRGGSEEGEYHRSLEAVYPESKQGARYELPVAEAHAMALREHPKHPLEKVRRGFHRNSFLEDSISEHEEYSVPPRSFDAPVSVGLDPALQQLPGYRHSYNQPSHSAVQQLPRRLSDSENQNRGGAWPHHLRNQYHLPPELPYSSNSALNDLYEDADAVYQNLSNTKPPPRVYPRQYPSGAHYRRVPPRFTHRHRRSYDGRRYYGSDEYIMRSRDYHDRRQDFGAETDREVYSDLSLEELRSSQSGPGALDGSSSDEESGEPARKYVSVARRRLPPQRMRRMRKNTADTSFVTLPPDFFPDTDGGTTSDSSRQSGSVHPKQPPPPAGYPYHRRSGWRPPVPPKITVSDTQINNIHARNMHPAMTPIVLDNPSTHVNLDNDPVLNTDSEPSSEDKSAPDSRSSTDVSSNPPPREDEPKSYPQPPPPSTGSNNHTYLVNKNKPSPDTPESFRRQRDEESTDCLSDDTTVSGSYLIDSLGPEDGVLGQDYIIV